MKDLENMVNKYIVKAMELTRDEIYEVILIKVSKYYNEDVLEHPSTDVIDYNKKRGNPLESLSASHITRNGNAFEFQVKWDDDYLTFRYPGGYVRSGSNGKYNAITELQAFNSGTHNYFNEVIDEINTHYGSIMGLFKQNCKKVGLPIK